MTFQCLCGFSLRLSGSKDIVDSVLAVLMPMHEGEGHGAADPRTAYRARKQSEGIIDRAGGSDDHA